MNRILLLVLAWFLGVGIVSYLSLTIPNFGSIFCVVLIGTAIGLLIKQWKNKEL